MPPQDYLATVTIPAEDANPKHSVQNSFALHDEDGSSFTVSALVAAIADFYSAQGVGQNVALASYMASSLERAADACVVKIYSLNGHLDGSPHGSPDGVGTFTLGAYAAASEDLPSQIAAVLTLRARAAMDSAVEIINPDGPVPPTQRPRARRSGRLYLGPLNDSTINNVIGTNIRPKSPFMGDMVVAAENLQDALAPLGLAWGVWSRTLEAISVITRVEADDSFDVIRRRKISPANRQVRTFAPVPDLALGS